MNKFIFLFIVFLHILSPSQAGFQNSSNDSVRAMKIHQKLFTVDTHTDTPMNFTRDSFDMSKEHNPIETGSCVDFPRMRKGGLDAVFLAVFIGQGERNSLGNTKAGEDAFHVFNALDSMLHSNSSIAALALSPKDAFRINRAGKSVIFTGLENGYPIGNDLSLVEKFYNRGARYITLCHTKNNDICDSSNDSTVFNGLSPFGEKVVREMNRLGMMIDVSHISDSSFYDVIRLSRAPVIASHSSSRVICDNPRNLSDDMLRVLAKNGGVAQVCLLSDYVKTSSSYPARDSARSAVRKKFGDFYKLSEEEQKKFREEWHLVNRVYPARLATVSDLCDHIDHMVQVAGIDHVGIGSDFDGGGGLADCRDVSQFPNITRELLRRGYSRKDLQKIWSGNFFRVFNEVIEKAGRKN